MVRAGSPIAVSLSSRGWNRLEKRGIAAHEHEVLAGLRLLALARTPLVACRVRTEGLGALELTLPGQRVVLTGITRRAGRSVDVAASGDRTLVLLDAGRYGRCWWLALGDETERSEIVLGAWVRVRPDGGGPGTPAPIGADDPRRARVAA